MPELDSIFDRHARALRKVGQHGMRRIAKQGHAAERMLVRAPHRRPVMQGPQAPARHRFNHVPERLAGACQPRGKFRRIGGVVPVVGI